MKESSSNRSLVVLFVGIVVALVGGALYGVGLYQENPWGLFNAGYVVAVAGSALALIGLSNLFEGTDSLVSAVQVAGVMILFVAAGYLSYWYPGNWHIGEPAGSFITTVGLLLFAAGIIATLYPGVSRLVRDPHVSGKQYYAGVSALAVAVVSFVIALALYSYTQLHLPVGEFAEGVWEIRLISVFFFVGILPTGMMGLFLLLPSSWYTKFVAIGAWVGGFGVSFIIFVSYPDIWHTSGHYDAARRTNYTLVLYVMSLAILLVSILSGVARNHAENNRFMARAKRLFYSSSQNRLRAPVRIAAYIPVLMLLNIVWYIIAFPLLGVVAFLAGGIDWYNEPIVEVTVIGWIFFGLGYTVAYSGAAAIISKFFSGRSPKSMLGRKTVEDFRHRNWIVATLIGAVAATIVVAILYLLGWMTVEPRAEGYDLAYAVKTVGLTLGTATFAFSLVYAWSSWYSHEVIEGLRHRIGLRGAIIVVLSTAGFWYGILVVGQRYFDIAHFVMWMVFFGAVTLTYILTNRITIPTGILFGFSFVILNIFGLPFEFILMDPILVGTLVGPEFYTGGSMGPGAGIVGLIVSLSVYLISYDVSKAFYDVEFDLAFPSDQVHSSEGEE